MRATVPLCRHFQQKMQCTSCKRYTHRKFFSAFECYYVPSASLLQMPKIFGSVRPCRGCTLVMLVPVQRCSCSRAHRAAFPSDHCKLLLHRLVRHQSYAGCFRGGAYVPCLRRQVRGRGWLALWVGQSIFACQKKCTRQFPQKKPLCPETTPVWFLTSSTMCQGTDRR